VVTLLAEFPLSGGMVPTWELLVAPLKRYISVASPYADIVLECAIFLMMCGYFISELGWLTSLYFSCSYYHRS
jgi:hypothetical protein